MGVVEISGFLKLLVLTDLPLTQVWRRSGSCGRGWRAGILAPPASLRLPNLGAADRP